MTFIEPNGEVKIFEVVQFHFHSPAEHTIDGIRYDAELHIVHKRIDPNFIGTEFAVVAILLDATKDI